MSRVRSSASLITSLASSVSINQAHLQDLAAHITSHSMKPIPWKLCSFHYTGDDMLTYIFIIDSLNFCFWPCPGFEYEHLAENLKSIMIEDRSLLLPTISDICVLLSLNLSISHNYISSICKGKNLQWTGVSSA